MSAARTAALIFLSALLLVQCRRSEAPSKAIKLEVVSPPVDSRAFADPGEDAPISDLAVDPMTHYLVAVSAKARKIGATQIPTGVWSWKNKLSEAPALLAVEPLTGEGVLVWQGERGGGLATFRPVTGESLANAELPLLPSGPLHSPAWDAGRNRLFFISPQGIACLDLASRRLVALRAFVGALDLAIDSQRALAIVPHAGSGVTMFEISNWGGNVPASGEFQLERDGDALPSAVAVDREAGRAYVLQGRGWIEIDLETRQIARAVAFDPEHHFETGRIAIAPACRRMFLVANDLIEVDVETGKWEPITSLGGQRSPLLYAPPLGALFAIQNGQIYSSYHRCVP